MIPVNTALVNATAPPRKSSIVDSTSASPTLAQSSVVPSGATAQTSGFAQAGSDAHSFGNPVQPPTSAAGIDPLDTTRSAPPFAPQAGLSGSTGLGGGFGGGLASSPNVPLPGTSINPATGQPHTAGLTRAELEAKKALAASGSSASAAGPSVDPLVKKLAEMPGREQAARQLTGNTQDVITPGQELPGGWGPVKPVSPPGSGKPDAVASVYEDIAEGLEKVGHAAYGLIPQGIKNALNPEDKGKQPMGSPPQGRRSSVTVLFENAKAQGEKVLHDVRESLDSSRGDTVKPGQPGRASGTIGSDGSVLAQVKNFFAEATQVADAQVASVTGPAHGMTLPSQENQGMRPGEVSAGVGALPGSSKEAGVALLPIEKAATGDEGGLVTTSSPIPATGSADRAVPSTTSSATHTGLAPPLPATHLGEGAASGATDLAKAGIPTSTATTDSPASSFTDGTATGASSLSPTSALESRQNNDRTTSAASITAIRHGHEGNGRSPLAETITHEDAPIISGPKATSADEAAALKEDKGESHIDGSKSTGVAAATSLTPGKETDGVGHPSSRGEDTTREPGTYPKANHDGPVDENKDITATTTGTSAASPSTPAKTSTDKPSAVAAATAASTAATGPSSAASPKSPHTTNNSTLANADKGHQRSSSNASTGSNGKKKVGFMSKLKGEVKVLSGKMSHNEAKVQEGERMKHGE